MISLKYAQKDELQIGGLQRGNPKENLSNEQAYHDSCPVCRLFGSTSFIGRVAISDAYLACSQKTEQRDGVGIDRFTGGAAGQAKFDLEVVHPVSRLRQIFTCETLRCGNLEC